MNPVEVFAKDVIKLNILSALLDGSAELAVYLESENRDVPFSELRGDQGGAANVPYRYNNFSVREDPGGGVAFCPVVVGCLAVFSVTVSPRFPGAARLEIVRRGASEETPAYSFPLGVGKNRFTFSPIDMKKYAMRAETAEERVAAPPSLPRTRAPRQDEPSPEESVPLEREAPSNSLAERRETLKRNIEWLSAHAEGDGPSELEELKSTLKIDEEILECYIGQSGGGDVEKLLAEVKAGIAKLEGEIRAFVLARQKKNLDIEKALKVGAPKGAP